MAYPYYQPYQQMPYQTYQPPMADQLAQLRQNQFQPQMQQPQAVPQQPTQQPAQTIIWVAGEQEAMGYLVAPNSAVALWDSTAPVIYLKQADASGKPTLKVYDLVERTVDSMAKTKPHEEYATKKELAALAVRLDALTTKELAKSSSRKTAKEDAPNE